MATNSIALAYCIDNLHTAEAIETALKQTDYSFDHYYCKKNNTAAPLATQLQDYEGPILLLISDNFLRSISCMQRALQLIQQKHDQLLPVVVDGFRHDEQGDMQAIETRFEKIGDIIPYINYWQNQYLDLRGQRKRIEDDLDYDKEAFAEHLRVLRQVSSEASEFLRVLRNMEYLHFSEFSENHFEAFFEWLQDEEEWQAFQAKVPELSIQPITPLTEQEQEEAEEDSIEQEQEEYQEKTTLSVDDIPGLDLLEESENIARIINQKMSSLPEEPDPQRDTPEEPVPPTEEPEYSPGEFSPTGEQPEPQEEMPQDQETPQQEPETPQQEMEMELEEEEEEDAAEHTATLDDQPQEQPPLPTNEHEDESEPDPGPQPVSEEELIQQGLNFIQHGAIEEGLTVMGQSLQDNPNMNDLRYHYSLMLAQNTSDFSGAINQLYTLLEMDPDHVDGNFLMGELSELEDHFGRARDYYERVAELDSHYPDIYYRLGVVTLNHFPDEKKKAAKFFKKAAKRNPGNVDAHYQYALLMNETFGKPHKALKYFLHVSELDEEHPFVHYDLALLYYKNGDADKARTYYERAVRLNPELQTEENDRAFLPESKSARKAAHTERSFSNAGPVSEQETIEALKENIRQLEEMIKDKATRFLPTTPKRKTVLITGATSGIGQATAYVFAREGYRLIINGRRHDRLEALKTDLEQRYGIAVLSLPFDVSDYQAVRAAVHNLPDEWATIDILVNNAGKAKGLAPVHEAQMEHWEEMIDVNLKGLLYLTREITPLMVERGEGHVINLCSTAGKEVYPNGNVYCATKHAVDALTKAMRIDLYEHNIRVSQVSPAHVEETEFAEVRFDGDKQRARIYEDFNPLTSYDVAETIYFIASRPAHVNVQDILVMGTQQANSLFIDRSGRRFDEEE